MIPSERLGSDGDHGRPVAAHSACSQLPQPGLRERLTDWWPSWISNGAGHQTPLVDAAEPPQQEGSVGGWGGGARPPGILFSERRLGEVVAFAWIQHATRE